MEKKTHRRSLTKKVSFSSKNIKIRKYPFQSKDMNSTNCTRSPSILFQTENSQWMEDLSLTLSRMPTKDRHFVTAEIKCFMTVPHKHQSHIMDVKIVKNAIAKMRKNEKFENFYHFSKKPFFLLTDLIIKKCSDSSELLEALCSCFSETYPPTVQFMLLYFAAFVCSISASYEKAEKYCQNIFDLIVRFKVDEYFILFLFLKVKLKSNLSLWEDAIRLLTKLIGFAWWYRLADLEIWCYFQLSRAFFFLRREEESDIFRRKSQNNNIQSHKSIYREVCISSLQMEILQIWEGKIDFNYDSIIDSSRLSVPEMSKYGTEQYISDQRKLKTSIKSISQECRIRHAHNLLKRVGELGQYKLAKQNQPSWNLQWTSGNNFLLTHQSFNKNMGMFFRPTGLADEPVLYTIENSQKNWIALKEMLKNIYFQMLSWSP